MRRFTSCIAAVFVATLVVAPASAAAVAPSYVSSDPSDGEELHRAPDRVEVTFSEPLDASSELSVEDSCGRAVDDGNVTIEGNTMTVGIALKPSGHYEVSYAATGLAGVTGTNNGGFHFMVHLGKACDGGGGHSGHGGKNKGGGGDGGGQHEGHGGGGGEGEHEGGSGGHSGSGHSSPTGGSGAHSGGHMSSTDAPAHSGGHAAGSGSERHGKRHGKGHGKGRGHGKGHGNHKGAAPDNSGTDETGAPPPLAAGDGQPLAPDGQAVMLALGLSLALGAVGGWFLRVSGGP